MSQPDSSHPAARVAADRPGGAPRARPRGSPRRPAPAPQRRLTWRRALVVAVPVAAAVAGAAIALPAAARQTTALGAAPAGYRRRRRPRVPSASRTAGPARAPPPRRIGRRLPAPSRTASSGSAPRCSSACRTRRPSPTRRSRRSRSPARSAATRRRSNVDAGGRTGYATLVLRIPKQHVQQAVIAALGARHDRRRERLDPGPPGPGRRDRPQDRPPPGAARLLAGAAADRPRRRSRSRR